MSSVASSSPPAFDAVAAQAHIHHLEAQLAEANSKGNQVLAQLAAEKSRASLSRSTVKVPIIPSFKGEVGFAVDGWLRILRKHMDFYGVQSFPDDQSRIRLAVMYLEGAAMDWWDNEPSTVKDSITSWSAFVDRLHARFRPMQAEVVARQRIASLKQTGSVSAYANLFQKELTPITDMAPADQVFYFRQGLKPAIAQRVLEKLPKDLHTAMDLAILMDSNGRAGEKLYGQRSFNHRPHGAPTSNSDMDVSNINGEDEEFSSPVFHDEESSEPVSPLYASLMQQNQQMLAAIQKLTLTQKSHSSISALASASEKVNKTRVQISPEEFNRCWTNRLCLKCKKSGHIAKNCTARLKA